MGQQQGDERLLPAGGASSHLEGTTEVPLSAGPGTGTNGASVPAGGNPFVVGPPDRSAWPLPPAPSGAWQAQQPATNGPWTGGGAWGYNTDTSYPPAPLPYAAFDTSAGPLPTQLPPPLKWRIGVQWTLFLVGWLLWPLWWVAAALWCSPRFRDPRERPGFFANCAMGFVLAVVLIAVLSRVAYRDYYGVGCWVEPITGICM